MYWCFGVGLVVVVQFWCQFVESCGWQQVIGDVDEFGDVLIDVVDVGQYVVEDFIYQIFYWCQGDLYELLF